MQTFFSRFSKGFIIGGVLVVLCIWGITKYNSLVRLSLEVEKSWATVEVQYQRRFDLIPNLVSSIQGAMKQEKDVFTAIANARQGYAGARTVNEKVEAVNTYESALSRLLVITENYPTLTSQRTVESLMAELAGTENRIAVERTRYNDVVKEFNVSVTLFPGNLIAKMFSFAPKEMLKSKEGADIPPKVDLVN